MYSSINKQLANTAKKKVSLYTDSKWTKIPGTNKKWNYKPTSNELN
jgi:hypothetical protein